MKRILLVGSGAREHAIASALARSQEVELYAAMSSRNPGITKLAEDVRVTQITDPEAVMNYATRNRIQLAVVGPEAPLVSGVVDALVSNGIKCVGPTRRLAALEGDKAFCRELLNKYGIAGNPKYRIFTDPDSAETYIASAGPVAIKPAGLTGGKGVRVSGDDFATKESEIAYARDVIQRKVGGVGKAVVEEKLEGEEYSMQAFVDGHDVYPMPLVQDHKRAYEGDEGPNTGGMGSYSDRDHLLPFVTKNDLNASLKIMRDVIGALRKETGEEYRGILYGQFMLARSVDEDRASPKLIEFNCRFGDPEAMNVLPILSDDADFLEICERIAEGNLHANQVAFQKKATVCKYLVPETYPEDAIPGQPIAVNEEAIARKGAHLFYASVDIKDGEVVTTASRTLGLVGVGDSIDVAERIAEDVTSLVRGPLRHRRDIGTPALVQKRIEHMRILRTAPTLVTTP